jgi:hypothetical protein
MYLILQVSLIYLNLGGKSSFSLGWTEPEVAPQKKKNEGKNYNYDQPSGNYGKKQTGGYDSKNQNYQNNQNSYNVLVF